METASRIQNDKSPSVLYSSIHPSKQHFFESSRARARVPQPFRTMADLLGTGRQKSVHRWRTSPQTPNRPLILCYFTFLSGSRTRKAEAIVVNFVSDVLWPSMNRHKDPCLSTIYFNPGRFRVRVRRERARSRRAKSLALGSVGSSLLRFDGPLSLVDTIAFCAASLHSRSLLSSSASHGRRT